MRPLVRSLISIPAGFRRMSLVSFVGYTTVGARHPEHSADRHRLSAALTLARCGADPDVVPIRDDRRDHFGDHVVRVDPATITLSRAIALDVVAIHESPSRRRSSRRAE